MPKLLTISAHAQSQALLEPAVLASVPVDPVDGARLGPRTLVVDHRGLRAAEEALAALAGDHAIVHARRLVAAHLARDDLYLCCKRERKREPLVTRHGGHHTARPCDFLRARHNIVRANLSAVEYKDFTQGN